MHCLMPANPTCCRSCTPAVARVLSRSDGMAGMHMVTGGPGRQGTAHRWSQHGMHCKERELPGEARCAGQAKQLCSTQRRHTQYNMRGRQGGIAGLLAARAAGQATTHGGTAELRYMAKLASGTGTIAISCMRHSVWLALLDCTDATAIRTSDAGLVQLYPAPISTSHLLLVWGDGKSPGKHMKRTQGHGCRARSKALNPVAVCTREMCSAGAAELLFNHMVEQW